MESTRRSHRLRLAAGLAATLLSAAPATAQEGTIVVSGSGTVTLAPDAATVLVAIESKADSANAAGRANADVVAAVRARLGELGIGDDDVTTSRYNVRQDWRRDEGDRVPDGYVAETGLDVSVNELADAGRVIDAVLAAGANRVDGVQFRSSRMDAARH